MSKAQVVRGFQWTKSALSLSAKFKVIFFVLLLIAGSNVVYLRSVLNKVDGVAETVNVAGKLRMLSQKIAMQAVYLAHHRGRVLEIAKTQHDFEIALLALENGGDVFGYRIRGVSPAFKPLLSPLRDDWIVYKGDIEQLMRRDSDSGVEFERVGESAARILDDSESLVTALTTEASRARHQAQLYLFLFFAIEALIFVTLLYVLRRRIVLPLTHLSKGAQALADGDYRAHIDFKSSDEIGRLVATFNSASQRIGQLIQQLDADREALRETEAMFRGLAENSIVGVYIAQDNRFIFANTMLADMFGYDRQQMLDSVCVLDLFVEEDRALVANSMLADDEIVDSRICQVRGRKRSGGTVNIEVFSSNMTIDGITSRVGVMLDISTRLAQQHQLEYLANHDELTGLPNRSLLRDRVMQAIAQAKRSGATVALLLLDLDHFKNVNDSLGHDAGDLLLQAVGQKLAASIRDGDTIARFGGDEFVVLMPDLTRAEDAALVATKIHQILSKPIDILGQEFFIGVSIGIALYPQDGDADSLLRCADLAMYKSKQEGRNVFRFYSADMDARNKRRITLERELHHAIANQDLTLHYQPKICLRTGRIVGAEALLRWEHPQLGTISPNDFIPLAEESGLILAIGEFVIREVCVKNCAWQRRGLPPIAVAVNLSGRQFRNFDLIGCVKRSLRETGLAAHFLELELTETILMAHSEDTLAVIHELRAMGVRFALDDFGAGYSSLNYLQHFPFDNLKLDKNFVHDINSNASNREIIKAVIALGRGLGLNTVAEGVETPEQLEFLIHHGCNEAQGFHLSNPLPVDEFTELLRSNPVYL